MTDSSPVDDAALTKRLFDALLAASVYWAAHQPVDETVTQTLRRQAILLGHRRYVQSILAYRTVVDNLSAGTVVGFETLVNELMMPGDLFKSYNGALLEQGDFAALTEWLSTIYFRQIDLNLDGIHNFDMWRARLRGSGVYLSYSSGTAGQMSLVPRDRATWHALRSNGRYYTGTMGSGDYDCLILGAQGAGMGLQASATGLALGAVHAHYLYNVEVNAHILRLLREGGVGQSDDLAAQHYVQATVRDKDKAYTDAFAFLERARIGRRRVLIFGAPFQLADACGRLLAEGRVLALGADALIVTGGGWKNAAQIESNALRERVSAAFNVSARQIIDTYTTSEINCVFMQCAHGRYHIPPLIEVVALDESLAWRPGDDVYGLLGVLDPFALSYPGFVITGDEGRLVRGQCECGLSGWSILGEVRRAAGYDHKGCARVMSSLTV